MLTALMINEPPERAPFLKTWRKLFPAPVTACMRTAANRPYVLIECERRRSGEPDWRMIAAYCLDSAGRLLMPPGTVPPAITGLRHFRPTHYCRRMLENLALDILICSDIPPSRRHIALFGREPEICELLPRLAPLAGSLEIISRRAYALEKAVSEITASTGMNVTVSGAMTARGCCMLLAPAGGAGVIAADNGTMVLAPDRPLNCEVLHIPSALPELPAELEELGDRFDTLELCGAFYELAGVDTLGLASPRCGLLRGCPVPPEKLAKMLRRDCI